ncbi:MAG: carbohydrate binding domain-containing protein [Litorilinea sp.]
MAIASKPRSRVLRWVPVVATMLALAWLVSPLGQGVLTRNLAWVTLSRTIYAQAESQNNPDVTALGQRAAGQFAAVIQRAPADTRAYLGLGLSRLLAGDMAQALDTWRAGGVTPALVMPVIDSLQRRGDWDRVFTLYAALAELAADEDVRLPHQIAAACYQSGWHLSTADALADTLADALPASAHALCSATLGDSPNLVVNGDFATGDLYGWTRRRQPGFNYEVASSVEPSSRTADENADATGHAALIRAQDRGEWGGLYQSIELPPGTRVRMRAAFRIEVDPDARMSVYFLQLRNSGPTESWQRTRGPLGATPEWTEYEAEYVIPQEHRGRVHVYPVFFLGSGNVWFKDVHLEIVEP